MSEWKRVKLSDVCEIPITDGTHQTPTYASENEGIPFLSSKDVTSQSIDWQNIKYITKDLHEVLYKRIAPKKDDILLAKNGTTGVAALVEDDRVFDIYVTLALLRPNQNIVYPKYLLRVINSPFCKRQFDSHLKGIGVPNLHLKEINETKIPLPPLEEQKRIAAILDKCTAIIAKRKAQLAALDELVKARFVEMFGVPGSDTKGWGLQSLGECCEINPKKSLDNRLVQDLEVSFVPMPAVSDNGIIDVSEKRLYDEVKTGFTYFAEGDVLFAKITPCMENGKGAVAIGLCNGIGFGSTEFHVLRPLKNKSNSYWLYLITVFSVFRKNAEANMTGSAGQRRVPATFLDKYQIALPPIELQESFALFVKQVDKSKSIVQKALDETQLLFDSLMQQYFG